MEPNGEQKKLTTWKEIAAFLGVSVRTAQDYEKNERLPVERVLGRKSRVQADREALERWKTSRLAGPVDVDVIRITTRTTPNWIGGIGAALIVAAGVVWFLRVGGHSMPRLMETVQITHSLGAKYSPVLSNGHRVYFTEVRNGDYHVA